MQAQEGGLGQIFPYGPQVLNLPTPGFSISSLQNCETTHFYCLKYLIYGCYGNPSNHTENKYQV